VRTYKHSIQFASGEATSVAVGIVGTHGVASTPDFCWRQAARYRLPPRRVATPPHRAENANETSNLSCPTQEADDMGALTANVPGLVWPVSPDLALTTFNRRPVYVR